MAEERDKISNLRPLSDKTLEDAKASFLPREGSARAFRPQGLANLLPKVTRKVAGKRPTLIIDLQTAWPEIVGQELARLTRPISLKARILILEMAQGAGPMVAMSQEKMLKAVRLHLAGDMGSDKVSRIQLKQVER